MISVPELCDDLRGEKELFDALAARSTMLAFTCGQRDAFNQVLRWATANQETLKQAGLAESLLRICGI